MKRSGPPERKTPLRRRRYRPRRKAVEPDCVACWRPMPERKLDEYGVCEACIWQALRLFVFDRCGERCEARIRPLCTGRRATTVHHVWLASQGGPDEAWNLLGLCLWCHRWIHQNVLDASARGLIVQAGQGRRSPSAPP